MNFPIFVLDILATHIIHRNDKFSRNIHYYNIYAYVCLIDIKLLSKVHKHNCNQLEKFVYEQNF